MPKIGPSHPNLFSLSGFDTAINKKNQESFIFLFLNVLGSPCPFLPKHKYSKVPETFLESFVFDVQCTLGLNQQNQQVFGFT